MDEKERKHRQWYIDENFTGEELQLVRDDICSGCKGSPSWSDSNCRYYCDSFIQRLREHDVATYR